MQWCYQLCYFVFARFHQFLDVNDDAVVRKLDGSVCMYLLNVSAIVALCTMQQYVRMYITIL